MTVVFEAFFDESGKRDNPDHRVVAVAGLLANREHWERFDTDWRQALYRAGVPYLHMREFAHFVGPFEKFKNGELRRRLLLAELLDIATRPFVTTIGSSVILEHYEALPEDFRENWIGDPYVLSARHVILESAHEADHLPVEDTVACPFEHSNQYGKVVEVYSKMKNDARLPVMQRIESLTPISSRRECTPIQVADLIAFEIWKHIEGRYYSPAAYEPRYPMKRILLSMQQQGGVFDKAWFDRLLLRDQDLPSI